MAYVDFTDPAWTEVDSGSKVTISASKVTNISNHGTDNYVYYDYGASYWSGDFTHAFDGRYVAESNAGEQGHALWVMSNAVDEYDQGLSSAPLDNLALYCKSAAGPLYYFVLRQVNAGVGTVEDTSSAITINTTYYFVIVRDETVGTNGHLYAYIYSDSGRTTLVDTLDVTLTEKQDFRYLFATSSRNRAVTSRSGSVYIENLDIAYTTSSSSSSSSSLSSSSSSSSLSSSSSSLSSSSSSAMITKIYSRGNYGIFPETVTDLETEFTPQDYIDVATENEVYVSQKSLNEYAIFQFKCLKEIAKNTFVVTWKGKSTVAPSEVPVYVKIYNFNMFSWEDIDVNSTAEADTKFTFNFGFSDLIFGRGILADYLDEDDMLTFRVYQLNHEA